MINFILLFCAGVFNHVQSITPDGVYTWFFRALSLISVILIIYINWNKAVMIFKKNGRDEN